VPRSRNAFLIGATTIAMLGAGATQGDGGVMLINGRF
jgi:hypothetical protein